MRQRIRNKRDRVRQLRVFCEVARLGSVTIAAERLGLTQPAVSIQIRELEYDHGAVLLERSTVGAVLTEAGERLYGLARPLVRGIDDLFGAPQFSLDLSAEARLRLAATRLGSSFVLPRYLKRFHEHYPELPVRVGTGSVKDGLARLLDERVDLMLGSNDPFPEDEVDYHELFTYSFVLITPLDHPLAARRSVSPQEVREYHSVIPAAEHDSHRFDDTAAQAFGIEANAVVEAGSWEMVKHYVEAGIGIAVVPSLCVHETDLLSVINLDAHLERRGYGVFKLRNHRLTPSARHFLNVLMPNAATQSDGKHQK